MRQHTFFGKGAPDVIPTALNQHYIDLFTRRVYLSRGTQSTEDWGPALVDEEALDRAIKGALQNLQLPGSSTVKVINTVRPSGAMPTANVDPVDNNGRFVVVSNPHSLDPENPENYIILNIATEQQLLENSEFVVHNSSALKMRVQGGSNVRLTLARSGTHIVPYGTSRLKLMSPGGGGSTTQWLVSGDTANDVVNSGSDEEIDKILQSLADAVNSSVYEIKNGRP